MTCFRALAPQLRHPQPWPVAHRVFAWVCSIGVSLEALDQNSDAAALATLTYGMNTDSRLCPLFQSHYFAHLEANALVEGNQMTRIHGDNLDVHKGNG